MRSEFPILYWPRKTMNDADYQLARKVINSNCGVMPEVVSGELDVMDVLSKNPGSVLYYPVFCGSTGWWGELLGGDACVTDKIIISPECQLMAIESGVATPKKGQNQLLAAEIYPTSGFFKKMNSSIATVSDMLATDAGTILALFSGKNPNQFINVLESTGNSYLGCIGRF
ncbi:hypothetical protein LJC18_04525 [Lachnospiraceae bacterium OttesenSCG-928-E19]|nr:hypothetical protein [Lachnospiraceae bacterium OttesenSCG-928-E19]